MSRPCWNCGATPTRDDRIVDCFSNQGYVVGMAGLLLSDQVLAIFREVLLQDLKGAERLRALEMIDGAVREGQQALLDYFEREGLLKWPLT